MATNGKLFKDIIFLNNCVTLIVLLWLKNLKKRSLFFGVLIPMLIVSADGLYLPIVFAFGTGLLVIVFTYLLAFTAVKIGVFYNKIMRVEKVMSTLAGVVFILTGLYYVFIFMGILG